jgi:hypothetical protein
VAELDGAGVVGEDGLDGPEMDIESGEGHLLLLFLRRAGPARFRCRNRDDPEDPGCRAVSDSAVKSMQGKNGTYLFELEAQPGGPEGRPLTTAGSKPIAIAGRPRGVRPRSPRQERHSWHLVPSPVSNSRTHNGVPAPLAGQASVPGSAAMLCFYHARYDQLNRLSHAETLDNSWGYTYTYL